MNGALFYFRKNKIASKKYINECFIEFKFTCIKKAEIPKNSVFIF